MIAFHFVFYLLLMLAVWAAPMKRFVLIVTNPFAGPDEAMSVIARAGGSFVEAGQRPWLAVAYSEDSDFAFRLVRAGALLVVDHGLAAGCLRK